jgi:tagatose 1,6-diphosphate aldolase
LTEARDLGRRQRLRRLADPSGIVIGLALDHRDSFRTALRRRGIADLDTPSIGALKERIVRRIVPDASALMLDLEFGGPTFASGAIPPGVGLILPLEAQGYEAAGDDRTVTLLDDFGPAKARALGAAACKVLVPVRPDRGRGSEPQLAVTRTAIEAAQAADLPIVVEPLVFQLTGESDDAYRDRYTDLILEATTLFAALGPDLLKLPFPRPDGPQDAAADDRAVEACAALDRCTGGIPWVVLGASVAFDRLLGQIRQAGRAGASGFLVGRSIWMDALATDPQVTDELAARIALPRFREAAAVAQEHCKPLDG